MDKKTSNYLYTVRSLVIVREPVASARGVFLTFVGTKGVILVRIHCFTLVRNGNSN